MVRTLPWLKAGSSAKTPAVHTRPSKRQRLLDPGSDSESTTLPGKTILPKKHAPLLPQKQTALRATERSPSTSPPPEPPTEEPMRPGLSADDIYIMVEDEFLSVARTFTAHLHHAEYIRLKNEARNRNSATLSNISRPVDSITTMRAETKKKKEAQAQEARTKAGVESIKGPKRPVTASDDSDIDETEGQAQPWEGTQLQRFMMTSPKKALTSLTGLQGVTSYTRAAAGYERSKLTQQSPIASQPHGPGKATAKATATKHETSEDDDDDLDAPPRAPSHPPAATSKPYPTPKTHAPPPPPHTKPTAKPPTPPRPRARRSLLDMTPLPPPPPTSTSKPPPKPPKKDPHPHPPTPYPEPVHDPSSSFDREALRARKRRMQARKEKEGRVMGADEIPIFLV